MLGNRTLHEVDDGPCTQYMHPCLSGGTFFFLSLLALSKIVSVSIIYFSATQKVELVPSSTLASTTTPAKSSKRSRGANDSTAPFYRSVSCVSTPPSPLTFCHCPLWHPSIFFCRRFAIVRASTLRPLSPDSQYRGPLACCAKTRTKTSNIVSQHHRLRLIDGLHRILMDLSKPSCLSKTSFHASRLAWRPQTYMRA